MENPESGDGEQLPEPVPAKVDAKKPTDAKAQEEFTDTKDDFSLFMKLNILVLIVFWLLWLSSVVSKNATLVVACLLGGGLHLVKALAPSAFGEKGDPEINRMSPAAVVALFSAAIAALLYRLLRMLPNDAGVCSYSPVNWHALKESVSKNIKEGVAQYYDPSLRSVLSSKANPEIFIATNSGLKPLVLG